jgi:hypothetical protein
MIPFVNLRSGLNVKVLVFIRYRRVNPSSLTEKVNNMRFFDKAISPTSHLIFGVSIVSFFVEKSRYRRERKSVSLSDVKKTLLSFGPEAGPKVPISSEAMSVES